jgi:hypothetical protein
MAFNQIALPANTPAIVRDVIRGAVEPYLSDVHAMLMLPLDGSLPHVGCNMAIAHVLPLSAECLRSYIQPKVIPGRCSRII